MAGAVLFLGYNIMMATKIYETSFIELTDGTKIKVSPLKIAYLREFMDTFELVKEAKDDDQAIAVLVECARIAMQQYFPSIKTIEDVEDNMNMPTVYQLLDAAAGIKINGEPQEDSDKKQQSVKSQASEGGSTWKTLDLAKLESEVFLMGSWKDYEELETSLSIPELMSTLGSRRELDYEEKKFLAAIQGVDIDKNSNKTNEWEEMKARVFSKGQASDSKDIVALQGYNAQKAGFGIGMGLTYEKLDESAPSSVV